MVFNLSKRSIQRLEGVNSNLIEIAKDAIKITNIDFGIPRYGGIRTAEEQNQLFLDKKSKADGFNNQSFHQSGDALDFYAYIDSNASWEHAHLAMVAAAFLQSASSLGYKIEWGGLWRSGKKTNGIPYGWDMAHIQIID